jgi:hypothetical protein
MRHSPSLSREPLSVIRPIVVAVAMVVAVVMVMVPALVVMLLLVTGRVIGAVTGNRDATATDRHHACDRQCRGDSFQHRCLLEDEFSVVAYAPGPREP